MTKSIDPRTVEVVRAEIAEYHRFQQIMHELVETNAEICDALLDSDRQSDDDPTGAEKRGSAARSRRKSKPS